MRLGDLFYRRWVCGLMDSPCSPDTPHVTSLDYGCGWRYQASLIPEDFERIENLELVRPELIADLAEKIDWLSEQVGMPPTENASALLRKKRGYDADAILKNTDMDAGIAKLLDGK